MVVSFHSGVRTRHVHGWASIIWLISAACVAVSEAVGLQAISEVETQCGHNLTLTCDTTPDQLNIKLFSWLAKNKTMCSYGDAQREPGVLCEHTARNLSHRLTLTLLNVMPVDRGNYLCKLRSTQATKEAITVVRVQNCSGPSGSFTNGSHATCWFSEVYPCGVIHWVQENVNLTASAITLPEKEDQHGRCNVSSTVEKGNGSQPYECSLWIPSAGKYLSSLLLPEVEELESSGNMATLQWISVMMEVMAVKLLT